jgi:hypothetical protein
VSRTQVLHAILYFFFHCSENPWDDEDDEGLLEGVMSEEDDMLLLSAMEQDQDQVGG